MEPSLFGRYPIKFAKIDVSGSGANPVVTAVSGKHIRVVAFFGVAGGAVTVKFQSSSTDLTGLMSLAANGGVSAEGDQGLFQTAEGEVLNVTLGGAVQFGGGISYTEVEGAAITAGDLA